MRRLTFQSKRYMDLPIPAGGGFAPQAPTFSGSFGRSMVLPAVIGGVLGAILTVVVVQAFD